MILQKRRLLAVFALCAVACQKGDAKDAKVDAKAGAAVPATPSTAGAAQAGAVTIIKECPKSLGGTDKVNRVISKDCGVVPVTEDYYVDGGSLTLEAGASLSFKDGVGLFIGYYEPARLIVQGSAEGPVVLTAAGDKAAGAWRGVSLNAHADRSSIEGLVIEYAGNDESALFVDAEEVTLKGVKIRDAKGTGLLVGDTASFAAFANNEFKKLGRPAAIDVPARAVAALGGGNRFDPNGHVLVRGGRVQQSAKWQHPGAPLVLAGEVNVDGEDGQRATLELVPGLELRFSEGGALLIGYQSLGGLNARGTAEAAITFTAHERREPGGWRGVGVFLHGEANIERALFEFAGKGEGDGAVFVQGGALALKHTTFRSDVIGVSLDESAKLTAFADNTFVATPLAVTLTPAQIAGLGEGNAYDRDSKIRSAGGSVKGKLTWAAQGAAIELTGEVSLDEGELEIDSGVALLAGPEAQLNVGTHGPATLRILGTVASPVTIGPVNGERGTWRGIALTANTRANVLENLMLTGAGNDAAIQVEGGADAKLSGVTCSRCRGAVVGWGCGAKVSSSQVLATDGTPKLEVRPEGC
ncbi:MAG: hypothetical protein H0T76_11890 [Nannocystis sp.]|nr:hypothetical protein [Nannocystis sp.]MBA3547178.1 hypothetical protein [Nannocystis sp.]